MIAHVILALAIADQVVPDDQIVQGGVCIGLDCVNGEAFGPSGEVSLILKENNTRILFDDTSTATGFASQTWALVANPSASGGGERFMVVSGTDMTSPLGCFSVQGATPTDAFTVTTTGVGFGTAQPAVPLHDQRTDTPGFALDQAAATYAAQRWDVAGNEANFFVRDLTGGSRLPLRVRPGAPSDLFVITKHGTGIGTSTPLWPLHAIGAPVSLMTTTSGVFMLDTSATPGATIAFNVRAAGVPHVVMNGWSTRVTAAGFERGEGTSTALRVAANGNVTISGTMSSGSSRSIKDHITRVEPADTLARVRSLMIATWRYTQDDAVHLGPMAEEFHDTLRVGTDGTHLAPADVAASALAAAKALAATRDAQAARIERLRTNNDLLRARIKRLERAGSMP